MPYKYISVLCDDDYLPGVMAVNQSLKNVGSQHDFLLLVTPDVSGDVCGYLHAYGIATQLIEPISSPYAGQVSPELGRVYSKLRIFGLTEYAKLVCLDLDTLVCANLDDVFDKPGWSAVNAGGMLPDLADWTNLNSGFMVIEPNEALLTDMLRCKDRLPSSDKGDQGFLHSYFPDWPQQPHLHLDHAFNLYAGHLNQYNQLFGYHLGQATEGPTERAVRVVHFWGPFKPWDFGRVDTKEGLHNVAFRLWWQAYEQALADCPPSAKHTAIHQQLTGIRHYQTRVIADFIQANKPVPV